MQSGPQHRYIRIISFACD